jgi:hypothetical protein
MTTQQSNRRAFERTLWKPPAKGGEKKRERPSRLSLYERLMQVSIRNDYYNQSDNRCPDFAIHPTTATSVLMRKLGLLFRDEGAGFSVLYDVRREENLLNYLRMQVDTRKPAARRRGVWTRLSFVLCLKNMYFANFTRIPITTNPANRNFFFSNQNARRTAGGNVILNRGRRVSGRELLPVTAVQHAVPVSDKVEFVRVYAISGVEVICEPRCVVPGSTVEKKDSGKSDGEPMPLAGLPEPVCTDVIYLDFSLLPEDEYTIERVGYHGKPVGKNRKILYTASYPTPLCFIDLLFTDPDPKRGGDSHEQPRGVYPVRNLWPKSDTTVDTVDYHLEFRRRKTIWSYYIVPQPDSQMFEQLEIVDVTRREREKPPRRKIQFAGPCCVRLANGSTAYRFISTEAIPLEQQSRFRFQLRGSRRGAVPHEGVLVQRLPVASNEQVLPESEDEVCRKLIESLCPRADDEAACAGLIDHVCSGGPVAGPPPKSYSEIYVYV